MDGERVMERGRWRERDWWREVDGEKC
jgi:hypothetical protein